MSLYSTSKGASTSEYALILALVAMMALGGLWVLGQGTSGVFGQLGQSLPAEEESGDRMATILQTSQDLIDRMQDFYEKHGRWPRSWAPYNFSDLGLDPDEWREPRDGVLFNPAGNRLGLGNALGDQYQLYVTNTYGEEMHIYDGYSVWYSFVDRNWYYHDIGDSIPVDINTLRVIEVEK